MIINRVTETVPQKERKRGNKISGISGKSEEEAEVKIRSGQVTEERLFWQRVCGRKK